MAGRSDPCARSRATAPSPARTACPYQDVLRVRSQARRGDSRGHRDTAGHGIPNTLPPRPGTRRSQAAVWSHADACIRSATRGFGSGSLSGCLRHWNRSSEETQKDFIYWLVRKFQGVSYDICVEFVREAVHEGVEPVLGHRVSAPAGGMGACRDRRNEDDGGARSRRADRRQRGLGHEIRGREVGLEDVVAVPFGR